jgi:hypothetical protein
MFKISKDKRGEWRWKLKAKNSKVIAVSEGYRTRQGCLNGIRSVHNTIVGGCWVEELDRPAYVL